MLKTLKNTFEEFRQLSRLSVILMRLTLAVFTLMLLAALILILAPTAFCPAAVSELYTLELLNTSTRVLTLGMLLSFVSDIALRH